MKEKEPVDIILIGWKRENFTQRSLRAIQFNTKYPFKITLIVNEGLIDLANYIILTNLKIP
jgi:hypothetical protein